MSERLEQLASKIDEILSRLEKLKAENNELRSSNQNLKAELLNLRKENDSLLVEKNDQSDMLKTKLVSVMDRLDELDSLTG